MERTEKWGLSCLFLLLAYPAWVRGGTYVPIQAPLPYLGAVVLLSIIVLPLAFRKDASLRPTPMVARFRFLRDPVFWLGLAFLAYLSIQWWNAGRLLVFSWTQWKWIYAPPRVPWLPSAVDADRAREMLYWFFPAWAVVLAVRSGLLGERGLYALYAAMATNGALVAIFGIVQYASGTDSMYWIQPVSANFFATFGYQNHAGAFFVLMFSVSCGLVLDGLFSRHSRASPAWLALLIAVALLNLAGASLALALVPMILVWLVAVVAAAYACRLAWQRLRPVGRLHMVVGAVAVLSLAYLLVAALYRIWPERVYDRLWELRASHLFAKKFDERAFLVTPAWAIWKDHPWFGVGGWGFRNFLGLYVDRSQWRLLAEPGQANVHNDPLQFLMEFGVVGAGLMAAVVVVLAAAVWRSRAWQKPLVRVPLLGALIVYVYSLMDLPFRCPAVVYAWLSVLAAMPGFMVCRRNKEENRK